MRSDDLTKLLNRQPNPILRLHLTGGQVFEIREPEVVVVTRSTIEILLPAQHNVGREAIINLLHLIWVEVLSGP